jgi:F-type H+-transporting ATPase subunit delta
MSVAKRYARALFSIAVEAGSPSFEDVGAELSRLAHLFHDAGLASVLGGGALDATARREILDRVVAETGVAPVVANFLRLLGDHGRLGELEAIDREYRRSSDRELGRVRAKVRTARPLDEDGVRAITRAFEGGAGGSVLAEVEVDPDLLGGVVVEIQGKVYDGSVRRELERLRASLAGQS